MFSLDRRNSGGVEGSRRIEFNEENIVHPKNKKNKYIKITITGKSNNISIRNICFLAAYR